MKFNHAVLDVLVTHRPQISATNDYNEPVNTYPDSTQFWAKRIDATLGEMMRASEISARKIVHFVTRYTPETASISPKDRLLEDGLSYDIVGVRELKRKEWIEIHAQVRTDD